MSMTGIPYIPSEITVHLGPPNSDAPNVTVPFIYYIKNVASSEIYPTWPENSLRANIYAQTTYALNRIYTEWYRSQGYDFDITNSTQYDQYYVPDRDIFDNVSKLVDQLFDSYVRRQGSIEPYFTQYCNGTTSTCPGLSQWGTVSLANQGYTPYEILQYYYGDDIDIVHNAPIKSNIESYPGTPMRLGSASNQVKTLQVQLNRIGNNYPSIPKINPTDGTFGIETENAVKEFQRIFNLTPDGIVGRATWYRIKRIYTAVKQLANLTSEGITIQELERPYSQLLEMGTSGTQVRVLQYYLDVISYFNPDVPYVTINGVFDEATRDAVMALQRLYGIPADGIVGRATWNVITSTYNDILRGLSPEYLEIGAALYPGYILTPGATGEAVRQLQTYLSVIADTYTNIPKITPDGSYGPQTTAAVRAFQQEFGLPVTGNTNAVTWDQIRDVYNQLTLGYLLGP